MSRDLIHEYADVLRELATEIESGRIIVTTFDIEAGVLQQPNSDGWAISYSDGTIRYDIRTTKVTSGVAR